MVRRPNDEDEATGNFAQDDVVPLRHVPRPLADPDEDDGDFEGDDPPTTAEPVRDDHHPRIVPRSPSIATRPIPKFRSDDAFDDDANPTMFDPHVPTGGAPRAVSDPYAPPPTNPVDDRQTKDLSGAARRAMEPTADLGPAARRAFGEAAKPRPPTLPPPLPPMVASGSSGPRRAPDGPRNPPGPTGPMLRPPPTAPPALVSNASGSQRVIGASGSQRAIAPSPPPAFVTDRKAALSGQLPTQPASQAAPTLHDRPQQPRIDDSSRTHRWEGRPQADQLPPPPVYPPAPPPAPVPPYPPAYPQAAGMQAPAPMAMQAISHKTPGAIDAPRLPPRQMPQVQIRSIADLNKTPIGGMGRLAPPRDPNLARTRNMQDVMIWGSVVVITASIVTLVIWLIAR